MELVASSAIAAVGGAVTIVAGPAALAGLGFTAGGIAAGSIAAKMMSLAAIANGGGVAAGTIVPLLQAAGATGGNVAITAAVTAVAAIL